MKRSAPLAVLILCLAACATAPTGSEISGTSRPSSSPSANPPSTPAPRASRIVISSQGLIVESSGGTELARISFTGELAAARATLTALIGDEPTVTHTAKSSCNLDFDKSDWNGLALLSSGSVPFRADKAFSVEFTDSKVGGSIALQTPDGTTVGMPTDALKATANAIDDNVSGAPGFTFDTTPVAGDDGVFSGVHVSTDAAGTAVGFRAPHLVPDYC